MAAAQRITQLGMTTVQWKIQHAVDVSTRAISSQYTTAALGKATDMTKNKKKYWYGQCYGKEHPDYVKVADDQEGTVKTFWYTVSRHTQTWQLCDN